MSLTKLPGSKWWIETDDATSEIIGTHNKAAIVADIQAISETLTRYPLTTQEESDYADLMAILAGRWTPTKNARIVEMLGRMWLAYGQSPRSVDAAQLQARLDALIILRNRLV